MSSPIPSMSPEQALEKFSEIQRSANVIHDVLKGQSPTKARADFMEWCRGASATAEKICDKIRAGDTDFDD